MSFLNNKENAVPVRVFIYLFTMISVKKKYLRLVLIPCSLRKKQCNVSYGTGT
jgi:hypothetical protein